MSKPQINAKLPFLYNNPPNRWHICPALLIKCPSPSPCPASFTYVRFSKDLMLFFSVITQVGKSIIAKNVWFFSLLRKKSK
jgi:hypothetical protein